MSPFEAPDPGRFFEPVLAVVVPVRLTTVIVREPRSVCYRCRSRRVLYRVEVSAGPSPDRTEARCAPCWGIR
jgi:hypothetical protein